MHIVGPNFEPNLAFVCRTDGNVTCRTQVRPPYVGGVTMLWSYVWTFAS
jgi:hypothetical protein